MYIVTISNDGVRTEIHGITEKLVSGSVVKGINTIDSFSFSLYPNNPGFNLLHDYTTLVTVYNTNRERYEFYGRVLYSNPSMDEKGLVTKDVTCESYLGFLCDSQQRWKAEQNWTVKGLLKHIIDEHNSQIEDYKQFKIGEVDVTDPNDNLYLGIKRQNTWEALEEKLLDRLGGEFRFRVGDDGSLYLDYLTQIGETKNTPIKLSRNMKSISQENDPTSYITRLIPLGEKLDDDTENRLDIKSVNGGKDYIDDEEAIAKYGLHVGYKEWDDVTEAKNLLSKSKKWLKENNRVLIKRRITALDLSAIGLDMDDFDIGNKHPIQNALLGIDDVSRIIKKVIDVCDDTKSTIDVGDIFKNLTDLQVERDKKIAQTSESVSSLRSSTGATSKAMNQRMSEVEEEMQAGFDARVTLDEFNQYKMAASEMYAQQGQVKAIIGAYVVSDSNGNSKSFAKILADQVYIQSNMVTMDDITADVIQNRLSSLDVLTVSKGLSVAGKSSLQNVSTSDLAVGGTFSLNAQTVSTTKLSLVTDFTQASISTPGGVAQKSEITFLRTALANATVRRPLAGQTITLN